MPNNTTIRRIYVASSWRNEYQPTVVRQLQDRGHQVYDFRNPPSGPGGFKWSDLDPGWEKWSTRDYIKLLLNHERAAQGFQQDSRALAWCDCCVLVMPCGRSAHLEAGWCAHAGKQLIVLLREDEPVEPELMYLLAQNIVCTWYDLDQALCAAEYDVVGNLSCDVRLVGM